MGKHYYESKVGLGSASFNTNKKLFESLTESIGANAVEHYTDFMQDENFRDMLVESVAGSPVDTANKYTIEDIESRRVYAKNSMKNLLESVGGNASNLHPLTASMFGIIKRNLVAAHLPRAVKVLTTDKPTFEIQERIPQIRDINDQKYKLTDIFAPGKSDFTKNIHKTFEATFNMGDADKSILGAASLDSNHVLSKDLVIASYTAVKADGTTAVAAADCKFTQGTSRMVDQKTAQFTCSLSFGTGADAKVAIITGGINFETGRLIFLNGDARVKTVTFKCRTSHETHLNALSMTWDYARTQVDIPDGVHIQFTSTKEWEEDTQKMWDLDVMTTASLDMGQTIERLEDLDIKNKIEELGGVDFATIRTQFDCEPGSSFIGGKEDWIKKQFNPFIEMCCISLKTQTQMENCHFRCVGNPMDIRLPDNTEYVYQKNKEFNAEITLDYDFAVTSNVHTIFYLSTDRMPAGWIYLLLIPNSVENNVSTVNHYRYSTFITNKYRDSKSPILPTLTLSSRYKCQEYFPVMAAIKIKNNELPKILDANI
jgi:hypothetical protein